jgi:hypothetical protein
MLHARVTQWHLLHPPPLFASTTACTSQTKQRRRLSSSPPPPTHNHPSHCVRPIREKHILLHRGASQLLVSLCCSQILVEEGVRKLQSALAVGTGSPQWQSAHAHPPPCHMPQVRKHKYLHTTALHTERHTNNAPCVNQTPSLKPFPSEAAIFDWVKEVFRWLGVGVQQPPPVAAMAENVAVTQGKTDAFVLAALAGDGPAVADRVKKGACPTHQ